VSEATSFPLLAVACNKIAKPLGEGSLPSSGKKQALTLAKENENDEKDLLSVELKLELWVSNGGSSSFRRAGVLDHELIVIY